MLYRHFIALLCCSLALGACGAPQVDRISALAQLAPIGDASASVAVVTRARPADPEADERVGRDYVLEVRRAAHRYDFALQACEAHARDARAECRARAMATFNADRAVAHRARYTAYASLH